MAAISPPCSSPSAIASFLTSLNAAQLKAVEHPPETPLQILAGPGSGKTKVLTSRIAYLILIHSLPPSSICAITFTNKAAHEMRERLTKLIGKQRTSEVKMGTFHALCARFLRKYATVVGIDNNFTICDAGESKKIIAGILKSYKGNLEAADISLKDSTVLSMISKAKSKGQTALDYVAGVEGKRKDLKSGNQAAACSVLLNTEAIVAEIYEVYEKALRRSNCLDFDDLLLFGVKLFANHKEAVTWCRHVLVDEFQDTNTTQYELMRAIAVARCVTVVGDPDQSIYGWRSADVENLAKMEKDFHSAHRIYLEENYRSTAAILAASLAIVAQDKIRIQKSLRTSHPDGITPVLCSFASEHDEASFLAVEIKRLVANMGGMLRWGDFVVLLRFNALSRAIESALQKEGIPSRVLGGHKFFERLEIKDLLAYLQLVDNPSFTPALMRAVNVPSRGLGDKTLAQIAARAETVGRSHLEVIEQIHDNEIPDVKPPAKRKLVPFVKAIRVLRQLNAQGTSPADLIRRLLELVEYETHLRNTQPDWESRWENVQELITFASEVESEIVNPQQEASVGDTKADKNEGDTPLRLFLQTSMLSSEGENQSEAESKEKVTISTCHAAKGLEWPVVMVPAVEQGTFPFYRSDDIEEERRLLYVACTRAQGLLYLSRVTRRKVAGEFKNKELSAFVSDVMNENSTLFTSQKPEFRPVDRAVIAKVLDRPVPDESETMRRVTEFHRTPRHYLDNDVLRNGDVPWHPAPLPKLLSLGLTVGTSFTSTRDLLRIPNMSAVGGHAPPVVSAPTPPANTNLLTSPAASRLLHSRTLMSFPQQRLPATLAQSRTPPEQQRAALHTRRDLPTPHQHPPAMHDQTLPAIRQPAPSASTDVEMAPPPSQGAKRRLGMGRGNVGYSNKKFKLPT